jgi:hypothetical protein
MQPFLEPCLLGAIHYLTIQLKTSTPETIQPYLEILSSLLEFLSPTPQEEDLFSTIQDPPKTSRVLQILSPSILSTLSSLTLDQAANVKTLLDPIVETLRPYAATLRPETSSWRKELVRSVRGLVTGLAQWSAGWGSGYSVPTAVDGRVLGAAVRSCGQSVVVRHVSDEMWAAEQNCSFHAGIVPSPWFNMFSFVIFSWIVSVMSVSVFGGFHDCFLKELAYYSCDCRVGFERAI